MTSATGKRSRAERGFTMIEMLITISIIMFLFALLVVAGGPLKKRSMQRKTDGQIQTLGILLESYKAKAGGYPKDGLDDGDKVETEDGTPLQSGAALTFALMTPVKVMKRQANGSLKAVGEEAAVGEFKDAELTSPYLDDPQARELLDGFDQPFHYDRLAGGSATYSRQGDGDVHLGWEVWEEQGLVHAEDPREAVGRAVESPGVQNVGGYDVWSHGPDGHTLEEKPEFVIANWRVPAPAETKE